MKTIVLQVVGLSPAAVLGIALRLARLGAVGLVSGAAAGVIIGGIGSRLAMRFIALANNELDGLRTENGNIAGELTLDGTLDLIAFGGIFLGILGGFIYVTVRRWVPGSGLWKGVAFGVLLFSVTGSLVIDDENRDFKLFDPPALTIGLFALLFPGYGIVVSLLVERFDKYVPSLFNYHWVTVIG